jgi:hypothetical protein
MSHSNNLATTASTISQLLNGLEHEDSNSSASAAVDDVSSIMRNPWDPFHCADWDMQQPNATCLARIKR